MKFTITFLYIFHKFLYLNILIHPLLTIFFSLFLISEQCENVNGEEYKYDFYFQRYLYALVLWDAISKAPRKSVSALIVMLY